MTLLLFDIDGTLVRVTGGVDQAVRHAVTSVTDRPASTDGVSFSGRTDPAIFRDVLRASGVADPESVLNDVIRTYATAAKDAIQPADVEVLPGVPTLLSTLARRPDVYLGLLTGNIEPIAYHKLRSGGLDAHFSVGAFGSDHADRHELPPVAVRRASSELDRSFAARHTVIVGDTQHDIQCARRFGGRSVAVCTGRYPRAELRPHTPDHLFENLGDPDAFIDEILPD